MFVRVQPGVYAMEYGTRIPVATFQPDVVLRIDDIQVIEGWEVSYVMVGNEIAAR